MWINRKSEHTKPRTINFEYQGIIFDLVVMCDLSGMAVLQWKPGFGVVPIVQLTGIKSDLFP